jgi:hypothetical protein
MTNKEKEIEELKKQINPEIYRVYSAQFGPDPRSWPWYEHFIKKEVK